MSQQPRERDGRLGRQAQRRNLGGERGRIGEPTDAQHKLAVTAAAATETRLLAAPRSTAMSLLPAMSAAQPRIQGIRIRREVATNSSCHASG
jgi:hypothetical protein